MKFTLKEKPSKVFWSETKQLTLVDEQGVEHEVRIGESSKFTEYFIWNEPGGWDEITDDDMLNYLYEQFSDDEYELERQEEKQLEANMAITAAKWVIDNGIDTDAEYVNKLANELTSELTSADGNYKEKFYTAYNFAYRYVQKFSQI